MANKPQAVEYQASNGKTIILDDPKKLIVEQDLPCIDGGYTKINGKNGRLLVRYDNKPELAAQVEAWKSAWATYEAEKAAEFATNVPGLTELEAAKDAAYNEDARYDRQFDWAMDAEDGFAPKSINGSLRVKANELSKKYPRAAMYLRAKNYTYASNYKKTGAGHRAMDLIAAGGSLEEAERILENWSN